MAKAISKITIVGGGTTGWLAALYFATHFIDTLRKGQLSIELIESDKVPIIGVGESLSPSMPNTLKDMDISETAFIRETDASFKLAGYFLGWDTDGDSRGGDWGGKSWVNPFVGYLTAGYEFERFEIGDGKANPDYAATISPCRDAIEMRKGPRKIGDADFTSILRYAYHTDASKFAPFLKRHAIQRGVTAITDHVNDVTLDEKGFATHLILAKGGRHSVEFVIDASGFESIILNKAMKVPLVDYSRHLLNDRAVVTQMGHADETGIEPATRATALKEGWAFKVPLYGRTGNGYVFSSKFTSDDDAILEFARYLGVSPETQAFRVIPMRVGRPAQNWKNNCVALGLAAGFVEPLEASAIYSVETSLKWLLHYFPNADFPAAVIDRYNDRTAALFDEVIEYIVMHYRLSHRQDSAYWAAQKQDIILPDRLAHNLEIWRHALPVKGDVAPTNYFDHNTYIAALFGKSFYPGGSLKPERHYDAAEWAQLKRVIQSTHDRAIGALPDHKALLNSIRTA